MVEQPWRIGLAVAVIAALVGGIVWFSEPSGGNPPTVASTSATTTTTGGDGSSTSSPDQTAAASSTSTPATAAPSPETAVLEATDRALAAWGEFAVTGDLTLVSRLFVAHGPQLEQLRGEGAALLAEPLGPPPYVFELRDPVVTMEDPGEANLAAQVVMTRPGDPPQELDWRIHLHQIDGTWQLRTVEPWRRSTRDPTVVWGNAASAACYCSAAGSADIVERMIDNHGA